MPTAAPARPPPQPRSKAERTDGRSVGRKRTSRTRPSGECAVRGWARPAAPAPRAPNAPGTTARSRGDDQTSWSCVLKSDSPRQVRLGLAPTQQVRAPGRPASIGSGWVALSPNPQGDAGRSPAASRTTGGAPQPLRSRRSTSKIWFLRGAATQTGRTSSSLRLWLRCFYSSCSIPPCRLGWTSRSGGEFVAQIIVNAIWATSWASLPACHLRRSC